MLKSMREGAKSTPMRVFLIVLAIGFALWGIDDVFRAVGSSDEAVEVGPVEVTAVDAAREFERSRRRFMPAASTGEAVAAGLLGNVLTGLVQQSLFIAEADRMDLAVTREMEKRAIADEPAFRDAGGRFSTILFNDILAQNGLDEEGYIRFLRRVLLRNQVMDAVNGGIRYPAASAEAIARWRLERRSVSHATVPVEPERIAAPGDSAVSAWYGENSETFASPDLRFATVVLAEPETFLGEVVVDEAALADAYEARADLYQQPERRSLRQMIFATAEEAEAALGRLRGGADFAVLAAELLGLAPGDIDLGEVAADELTESLAAAAFATPSPGFAAPVETPLGHHVLEVASITPASTVPLEEARERLAEDLRLEMATDLVYERANRIDELLAAGSTLEETARETGAALVLLAGMDRNGLDSDGNPVGGALEALATDTEFRESVWTSPVGEPGIVEESGGDGFFVVRVDREEPARPRELAEVRDRVVEAMKLEAAVTRARETAAGIADAPDPAAAADTAGFPFSEPVSLRRDGVGLDHASARLIASRAFELEAGGTGYVETGDEAIVVTAAAVVAANADAVRQEGELFGQRLTLEMLESAELALLRGFEGRFGVRVNPAAVQRVLTGTAN